MVLGKTQLDCRLSSHLSRSTTGAKSAIKSKLFNLMTVCLATSGLLAPTQAAFGHSMERQISLEQAQHLACVKEGQHFLCNVEPQGIVNHVVVNHDSKYVSPSRLNIVLPLPTPAQQKSIANILLWLGYILPCGICLGIFLYDRYCATRTAALQQQIEVLEKLWKQSTQH
ncbi:MAG: hypothetical protein NVS2B14_18750 [Chamaesiphon sp.]